VAKLPDSEDFKNNFESLKSPYLDPRFQYLTKILAGFLNSLLSSLTYSQNLSHSSGGCLPNVVKSQQSPHQNKRFKKNLLEKK
jgi:hypothetical protein